MIRFTPVALLAAATLTSLPGLLLSLLGVHLDPPTMAMITGLSILGASFLLLWACDVAQMDIPQTLALAVIALVAVLPEYAVDMYFTWMAGQDPGGGYAHYAIANMTGANRLLIGVAWAVIVGIFWLRTRGAVILDAERRTEVLFLGLATLYAFVIPIKGSLAWYDGLVFVGLYIWYIVIASRRPCEECELEGPAELIGALPAVKRRLAVVAMLLFSAGVILACAEPFSESLVATGKVFGVNEFLLVQWLAPIASEAPEFIVAIMFVLRGHAGIALGSLLSAKLNQWTLLVGMIPGVYGVSAGTFSVPMPMDTVQMSELLLTAAQSLLAVGLLCDLRLSIRGAMLLLGLFSAQFLAPVLLPGGLGDEIHHLSTWAYIACFAMLFYRQRQEMMSLRFGVRVVPVA